MRKSSDDVVPRGRQLPIDIERLEPAHLADYIATMTRSVREVGFKGRTAEQRYRWRIRCEDPLGPPADRRCDLFRQAHVIDRSAGERASGRDGEVGGHDQRHDLGYRSRSVGM